VFEEAYHSLKPALQVMLSNNLLQRAPSAIFSLENIKVLSLRNNELVQLPDNVSKLRNLVELNVASNRLRWLPWELLALVNNSLLDRTLPNESLVDGKISNGKLINLHVLPNPFIRPCETTSVAYTWSFASELADAQTDLLIWPHDLEQNLKQEWFAKAQRVLATRMEKIGAETLERTRTIFSSDTSIVYDSHVAWKKDPIYLSSTEVTLFHVDGTHVRSSPPPPSTAEEDATIPPAAADYNLVLPSAADEQRPSRVPSLFEAALLSCSDHLPIPFLKDYLSEDAPETVLRALNHAQDVIEDGGRYCSVCKRRYVQARAEWIEYWHCSPESLHVRDAELFLPFLRRACSWVCALDAHLENRGL